MTRVIDTDPLVQFQQRLGYTFSDLNLLRRALTHRSFGASNNERLEFLGDSVLGVVIGEALYRQFPEAAEGQLTRQRSTLVKGVTLAKVAKELGLGSCLRLGEGELKSGGKDRESILADALESVIGAIYLEVGFDQCAGLIRNWFEPRLQAVGQAKTLKDTKTQLQEWLQARGKPLPVYEIVQVRGQSHEQQITVACQVSELLDTIRATATSRKKAEKLAAASALEKLMERDGD